MGKRKSSRKAPPKKKLEPLGESLSAWQRDVINSVGDRS